MENTKAALRVVLADTFVMYFRTHSYHWNVEGRNFGEMHAFFSGIYEDLYGTVDVWAEQLRALNEYAPISLAELYDNRTMQEDGAKPATDVDMLMSTLASNNVMIANLDKLFEVSSAENLQNVADIAASRLDIHRKNGWMINSYLKG
jgi:starvation-inducible DNA-binding protein